DGRWSRWGRRDGSVSDEKSEKGGSEKSGGGDLKNEFAKGMNCKCGQSGERSKIQFRLGHALAPGDGNGVEGFSSDRKKKNEQAGQTGFSEQFDVIIFRMQERIDAAKVFIKIEGDGKSSPTGAEEREAVENSEAILPDQKFKIRGCLGGWRFENKTTQQKF